MSDNFSWMSPQEHSGSVGRQDKFEARRNWVARNLERLKERPGTWALVHEGSSSSNGGDVYKVLGCEVTVRANFRWDKKTLDIYARWPVQTQQEAA